VSRGLWHDHGFRRFFRAVAPDVVSLLVAQGEVSVAASGAFLDWSEGGTTDVAALVALERDADEARRHLLGALRAALATPIDQEDLYILSERCDRVVNTFRDIAVEAQALAWSPDRHAARMAAELHAGMTDLVEGFGELRKDVVPAAGAAADRAREHARSVVWRYRDAIAELYRSGDLEAAVVGRELYRPYVRAADLLEAVADRLWFVVLAEA
jgi:uncharacterized protein Yka (UPF0111/DUF47 family)